MLAAFTHHVQHGGVSRQQQCVCAKTVEVALRAVTKKLKLDGQQNPLVTAQGSYVQAIKQLLACYRKDDPPVQQQTAVPLSVLQFLRTNAIDTRDPRCEAVANTCIIAFYFLLRSCEYTKAPETNRRQTKPFWWRDVQLWHNSTRLPIDLPYLELQQKCTSITLCIENQKTG